MNSGKTRVLLKYQYVIDKFSKKDIYLYIYGLTFWLILIIIIFISFIYRGLRAPDEISNMGKWEPLINLEDAYSTITVNINDQKILNIQKNDYFKELNLKYKEDLINTHIKRFNNFFNENSVKVAVNTIIRAQMDNIFEISIKDSLNDISLNIRDLSVYNRIPPNMKNYKTLGNIYFKPSNEKIYSLTSSYLNLFLEQGNKDKIFVDINHVSHKRAGQITLIDHLKESIANFKIDNNYSNAILAIGESERSIFIENNPPKQSGFVKDGDIVEVGGLFFECRIENSIPIVETTFVKNKPKRRYPFENIVHFVGPVSLDSSFQSLGIEYMFQEYLMGVPELNIPKGEIWLTIEPLLHVELISSLNQFSELMKLHKSSALIMNAKTGAILAMASIPEGYNPGDKSEIVNLLKNGHEHYFNHGCFKRHIIGSLTKPFFAFLALNLLPNIDKMQLEGIISHTNTIFGHNIFPSNVDKTVVLPFLTSFDRYLYKSINAYQLSLGFLLFSGINDLNNIDYIWKAKGNPLRLKPVISKNTNQFLTVENLGVHNSRNVLIVNKENNFGRLLRDVFDIKTSSGKNFLFDRDVFIYSEKLIQIASDIIRFRNPSIDNPIDIIAQRSVVCAPEFSRMIIEGKMTTIEAATILFGGNRNMWTDVKICEVFSRLMTGRKVIGRIIDSFKETRPDNDKKGEKINLEKTAQDFKTKEISPESFKKIRKILHKVTHKNGETNNNYGTAYQLEETIKKIQKNYPAFNLIGKTGTLKEDIDSHDSKLFVGTFGNWDETKSEFIETPYTFVVYLRSLKKGKSIFSFIHDNLPKWWDIINKNNKLLKSK